MISTQSLTALFQQALSEHWGYICGTSGVKWTATPAGKLFPVPTGIRAAEE